MVGIVTECRNYWQGLFVPHVDHRGAPVEGARQVKLERGAKRSEECVVEDEYAGSPPRRCQLMQTIHSFRHEKWPRKGHRIGLLAGTAEIRGHIRTFKH